MATKIRLKRLGGKHDPHFRIVIADAKKRRDGSAIEELGYYCPVGDENELQVNAERIQHWLEIGAQPTETVRSLLIKAGVIEGAEGQSAEIEETEAAAEEPEVEAEATDEQGAEEADEEASETEEEGAEA
ncbi:MAG: 30S ribosomal protein S16 [Armatimonadota bacterium]